MDREMEWRKIGGRLSACRQNKNLTQEGLAGRLGITPQALSKWERGVSYPDISMLAEVSRLLGVSADYLLGIGPPVREGSGEEMPAVMQEIGNNLRRSLEPLELVFGLELVPPFQENTFGPIAMELRRELALEGILLPIFRLRDHSGLEGREFQVLAYRKVLYSGRIGEIDGTIVPYMIGKLGECVRASYHEILNPEIMKSLVENLEIGNAALIGGVIPERLPYSLLTGAVRRVLARGGSIAFLPKMIEIADCALWEEPRLGAEGLAERIWKELPGVS